jgi:2-C-methyl-D-erythritol 4-phosphate cytidylyltransferase
MKCAALVTTGGVGKRMGAPVPKQYLDLNGRPLLAWTLAVFQSHALIDRIVVTVPHGDEDYCLDQIVRRFELTKVTDVLAGGSTRQDSVRQGLLTVVNTDLVVVHDGVRPLVSVKTITESIAAAQTHGAAVACVPLHETLKKSMDGRLSTISRTNLLLAHTPQTFQTSLIIDAHRKALEDGFIGTDDGSLVERLGLPVVAVEDSEDNIKITTPVDLELARKLLQGRRQ